MLRVDAVVLLVAIIIATVRAAPIPLQKNVPYNALLYSAESIVCHRTRTCVHASSSHARTTQPRRIDHANITHLLTLAHSVLVCL